eukprot:UN08651
MKYVGFRKMNIYVNSLQSKSDIFSKIHQKECLHLTYFFGTNLIYIYPKIPIFCDLPFFESEVTLLELHCRN